MTLGEKESIMSMEMAKTLKQVGLNKTLIQPAACFALCDKLEPCHECWKVKQQIGTVGSVCQFEGFRKIKRIPSGLDDPFRFEAYGFLDPYSDPSEQDRALWTSPTKKDLDVDTAKMILLRAGGEFCNLAKTELDMVANYKKNVSGSVIWKRLQPQVREMCDVCSTSLFNAHFTCDQCGIIVCIDCQQVRLKGNLAYQGSSGTYKSKRRRIQSTNFDSHY